MFKWITRLVLFTLMSPVLASEFVPETASTEVLDNYSTNKWFWAYGVGVPHASESRAYLFDGQGTNLAQLNTGTWLNSMLFDHGRDEILTVETYFSRGTRGERSDQVVVYDPKTLLVKEEIPIPPKRMHAVKSTGAAAMSDDNRFLLIANYTPAQSITVVDLESRETVVEVETPGCSVFYPAGNRDFYSICGNGGFLQIRLDESGQVAMKKRHEPVFDPVNDFLTTAASRIGDTWFFVSFLNNVYAITMTPEGVSVADKWTLVSDQQREDNWRISGQHHTAVHRATNRLFVLMHQGETHTFEEPGVEVWVYDVSNGARIQQIKLDDVALSINVSQDESATLYSLAFHVPLPPEAIGMIYEAEGDAGLMKHVVQVVDLYNTETGEHLNKVGDIPIGYLTVVQPW